MEKSDTHGPEAIPFNLHTIFILRTDALGDFILSIPVIKTLYEYFHSLDNDKERYRIILLTSPAWLQAFPDFPYADKLLRGPGDISEFKHRTNEWLSLYSLHPEIIIDLTEPKNLAARWVTALSTAKETYLAITPFPQQLPPAPHPFFDLSFPRTFRNVQKDHSQFFDALTYWLASRLTIRTKLHLIWDKCSYRAWSYFYSHLHIGSNLLHISQNKMNLANMVTGQPKDIQPLQLSDLFWMLPDNQNNFMEQLPKDYYIIGVGCSSPRKNISPQKYAVVIQQLHQALPDTKVLFIGLEQESKLAAAIQQQLPEAIRPYTLDCCGKYSLKELGAVMRGSKFMISYDTGTGHMAGLLGLLVFVLISHAEPREFFPSPAYLNCIPIQGITPAPCDGCKWTCPFTVNNTIPCLESISPTQIVNKILNTISPKFREIR